MTLPIPQHIREALIKAVSNGHSIRSAARLVGVSSSAARSLVKRVRETGSIVHDKIGGYRRPMLKAHADFIQMIVASNPKISLSQLRKRLQERGVSVRSLSTIWLMLS